MGMYAQVVNAYATDIVNAKINKRSVRYNDYGQRSLMLNVSIAKFKRDVFAKAQKLAAKQNIKIVI